MKSNTARRIDDTDDPRLPHPMFPRSDGQPESRRIFYIRLFRKRTPDGPIEFCPLRFLASESREEGWTHFVKRFGGGYYRAEATSSANKKQAYTGGSSLRWFHFAGPSKPFPLPGSTVQAAPEPSPPAMPSATWNELRALLKSERRAFAEQLEAERKAGDERTRAWMEHAEKMAQAESARMQAMDAMLREERERSKEAEERLIDALHWFEKTARYREDATRDALLRVTEVMRVHAGNEAVRIAYDDWRPVDTPKPRKPRKPRLPSIDPKPRAPKGKKAKARDEAPSDRHGGFSHPPDLNFAREMGVHFKPEAYRSAVVAHLRRPDAEAPSEQEDESFEPSPAAMAADIAQREESSSDNEQHGETNTADSESKAEDNTGSEATNEAKTASDAMPEPVTDEAIEGDSNAKPSRAWELLQRWREELEQKQTRANTKAVPPSERGHVDSSSTLDSASIRVQQRPPINVPEGTTTVRTLHGWVTIPSEWLEPDASPAELASLARLLGERP